MSLKELLFFIRCWAFFIYLKNFSQTFLTLWDTVCKIQATHDSDIIKIISPLVILLSPMLEISVQSIFCQKHKLYFCDFWANFTGVFTLFSYSLIIHVITSTQGYKKSQYFSNLLGPGTEWFLCKKSQNVPTSTDDIARLWMHLLIKTLR